MMPYLIDGHNLIPFIPGLSLDQIDDEMALVQHLLPFFQSINKKAIIYFDQAFPASHTSTNLGKLSIHFIRPPRTADEAILHDLTNLGGNAKNYIVVTSDQTLCSLASHAGARVISSLQFARLLHGKKSKKTDHNAASNDVDYWLHLFEKGNDIS